MRNAFLTTLEQRTLLCDGAMGTLLHERGVPVGSCLEALNLEEPSLLLQVHSDYIDAGADIIETNTFGANALKLARVGLEDRLVEANQRAVEIALQAKGQTTRPVFVAGAIGPLDIGLPGSDSVTLKRARRIFKDQAQALIDAGVDVIAIETFPTLAEAKEALSAVRECGDGVPVIVQLTFQRDGRTWAGEEPGAVAVALRDLGANVIGVNCVAGPQVALEIVKQMAVARPAKLSAQPNAGQPQVRQQTIVYPGTPQSFAEYALRLVEAGASVVGGCCGTTPKHTAAMNQALSGQAATVQRASKRQRVVIVEREPSTGPEPVTLREKLAAGRFVVTVEVDPPRGLNAKPVIDATRQLGEAGVDCVNIGDSPMARTHLSAMAMATMLWQQTGVETIVHCTTRDRNLIALEGDLLGGHVLGIRNVLCLRGDPPKGTGHQKVIGVWDVNTLGLIGMLKGMNEGVDSAGNSIGQPASFFVGAAANPMAPVDIEMKVTRRKAEAGADFLLTQPVFDFEAALPFLEEVRQFNLPVILGIMPLYSHRHAEFIHHELGGVTLPDAVRERMRMAGEDGLAEGMAIARELLEQVRGKVQGVCIMPSFGRFDVAADLAVSIQR